MLEEREDKITWKLTIAGVYTAKSAYQAFFTGRTREMAATELWSAGAPLLHKLHIWFLLKNKLWTADRLQRSGPQHPPECPLCCQEPETANHITLQCSVSRHVWFTILLSFSLHRFTPAADADLALWWSSLSDATIGFLTFTTLPMGVCRKIKAEFQLWLRAKLCGVVGEIE
jgi:hypothetical protein